jgi:prophage regulatory protein
MQGNFALCNPKQRKAIMGNSKKIDHVSPQFYRLPQLKIRLGVSGSSIWSWVRKGTFPAPVKLSENTTAWHLSDIEAWEKSRITASQSKAS